MLTHDGCVVSIDPGAHGAIALFNSAGKLIAVADLPTVEVTVGAGKTAKARVKLDGAELVAMLSIPGRRPYYGYIEHQQAMGKRKPGPDGAPQKGDGSVQAFALGETFGLLKGILTGLRIGFTTIRPQDWKKGMGLPSGGDKELSRQLALRRFPHAQDRLKFKKNEARAEAILIGEWGMQRYPAPAP